MSIISYILIGICIGGLIEHFRKEPERNEELLENFVDRILEERDNLK